MSETNAYSARIIQGSWRDTDERELKAYLGILIVMGIVPRAFGDVLVDESR